MDIDIKKGQLDEEAMWHRLHIIDGALQNVERDFSCIDPDTGLYGIDYEDVKRALIALEELRRHFGFKEF